MNACCFFGHHDAPVTIKPLLQEAVQKMIVEHGVTQFYVGDKGAFDRMAASALREAKLTYPHIDYKIVLAYMPGKRDALSCETEMDTLLPDGIETVTRRFAISFRNKWMVNKSDFVICYITHSFGGAAQYVELAKRQGKSIINLANK